MDGKQYISQIIHEWRDVRRQRLELEKQAKQIQDGRESELKAKILMYLDAEHTTGVKTEQGTVSRKTTNHMQIEDTELACRYMFQEMIKALQENRKLSDCLVFQKTPHKGYITELVHNILGVSLEDNIEEEQFNSVASQLGMKLVSKADITFSQK